MFCSSCGKSVEINARFCSGCGQQVNSGSFCSACGSPNNALNQVCSNCGVNLTRDPAGPTPQYVAAPPLFTPPVPPIPAAQPQSNRPSQNASSPTRLKITGSSKSRLAAALLTLLLGQLGIHRFYVGKKNTALLILLISISGYITIIFSNAGYAVLGILGLWVLIDFILISTGKFKDGTGRLIR
jgi:TM2 domain-containing membrane protein YozV